MVNENHIVKMGCNCSKKMPLDIKTIAWILVLSGFLYFVLGLLFISGLSEFSLEGKRPAFFGIFSLVSEISSGIYFLLLGITGIISAYGLGKRYQFGWWMILILSLNSIFDGLPLLQNHMFGVLCTTSIRVLLIFWLIYRRKLYGIGLSNEDRIDLK